MMTGAIIGTVVIVLVTVVIGLFVDRKLPLLPKAEALERKKPAIAYVAGEAPATALRIGGEQLEKLRTSQRCRECRAAMQPQPDDHVRYDDADLLVLHFSCDPCGAKRTIYVAER